MKKKTAVVETVAPTAEAQVHPLMKSHMFISKKHVDYDNLSAFEAVSMASVLVLAVTVGVLQASFLA